MIKNYWTDPISDIQIVDIVQQKGQQLRPFPSTRLNPQEEAKKIIHVFFNGLDNIRFALRTSMGKYPITLKIPPGEMICKSQISTDDFEKRQKKMSGMNEN